MTVNQQARAMRVPEAVGAGPPPPRPWCTPWWRSPGSVRASVWSRRHELPSSVAVTRPGGGCHDRCRPDQPPPL